MLASCSLRLIVPFKFKNLKPTVSWLICPPTLAVLPLQTAAKCLREAAAAREGNPISEYLAQYDLQVKAMQFAAHMQWSRNEKAALRKKEQCEENSVSIRKSYLTQEHSSNWTFERPHPEASTHA